MLKLRSADVLLQIGDRSADLSDEAAEFKTACNARGFIQIIPLK